MSGIWLVGEAELAADDLVVLPVGVALVGAEPPHVLGVDEQRGVDDRGEDPQQQLRVVGRVGRAGREVARRLGELAADAAVHGADAPGQAVGRGARAEGDRVHDLGGAGQALVGLVERAGVREEAGEGHRVGRLQQQRARAGEADHELAVDPADHRVVGEVGRVGNHHGGGTKRARRALKLRRSARLALGSAST